MIPGNEHASLFLATADLAGTRLASLTVSVAAQIAAFQFLMIRMSRVLPRPVLAPDTGPESVA
ncbi:hypothetical protein H8E07_18940, partial [bacterium]|nr:hypothetical protein [bacterium]